jgi:hypothetical protein
MFLFVVLLLPQLYPVTGVSTLLYSQPNILPLLVS